MNKSVVLKKRPNKEVIDIYSKHHRSFFHSNKIKARGRGGRGGRIKTVSYFEKQCHLVRREYSNLNQNVSSCLRRYNSFSCHCMKSVQIRCIFWFVFSRIRTEYGEIRSISSYSVRMRENTDQKKHRIWTLFNAVCQQVFCRKDDQKLPKISRKIYVVEFFFLLPL